MASHRITFAFAVGQIIYNATKKKQAWYPEEHDDWEVPEKYLRTKGKAADSWKNEEKKRPNNQQSLSRESSDTVVGEDDQAERSVGEKKQKQKKQQQQQQQNQGEQNDVEGQNTDESEENKEEDPNIVTWYGPNDTANPQNWSLFKKCCVTAEMCLLTFSIYIGSA